MLAFRKTCILVLVLVFLSCATFPLEQPTLDATVGWQRRRRLESADRKRRRLG
jgi:hypothetical protein